MRIFAHAQAGLIVQCAKDMGGISQKVVDGANCRAYILFIATPNGRRDEMRKLKKVQRRLDIRRSDFNRGPQGKRR